MNLEIIKSVDMRELMTTNLKDKNLTITVFKGDKQLTSEYALIDTGEYGKVFKDFSRDVINYLGIALDANEQKAKLRIVVKRNNEIVYEFQSDYRALRKGISDIYRKQATKQLIDAQIVSSSEIVKLTLNAITDSTTTITMLGILSDVAQKTDTSNLPASEYWKLKMVDDKITEQSNDGEVFEESNQDEGTPENGEVFSEQ